MQASRVRIGATILAFLFLLAPAVAPAADPPLTTRQREALSPGKANRTVQQDLLSVLEPVKHINSGMFRALHGVSTQTRPFGTEFKGVCRRDAVTLWYAPTETDTQPEDAPVQPYSIEAAPLFHIVDLPKSGSGERRGGELVWQNVCNGLSDNEAWFGAKDAFHAVQGALVLEQAVLAVRSGKLKPAPCPDIIHPDSMTCTQVIAEVGDIKQINRVETCAAPGGDLLCSGHGW